MAATTPSARRHRGRSPTRPAPTSSHRLRMPRLRTSGPRRSVLPGLLDLDVPDRHRGLLPQLRRARGHHGTDRHRSRLSAHLIADPTFRPETPFHHQPQSGMIITDRHQPERSITNRIGLQRTQGSSERGLTVTEDVGDGAVRLARVEHCRGCVVAKMTERDRRLTARRHPSILQNVQGAWARPGRCHREIRMSH
jgi:hypothetical protein